VNLIGDKYWTHVIQAGNVPVLDIKPPKRIQGIMKRGAAIDADSALVNKQEMRVPKDAHAKHSKNKQR
jgi:hypothetical protein